MYVNVLLKATTTLRSNETRRRDLPEIREEQLQEDLVCKQERTVEKKKTRTTTTALGQRDTETNQSRYDHPVSCLLDTRQTALSTMNVVPVRNKKFCKIIYKTLQVLKSLEELLGPRTFPFIFPN